MVWRSDKEVLQLFLFIRGYNGLEIRQGGVTTVLIYQRVYRFEGQTRQCHNCSYLSEGIAVLRSDKAVSQLSLFIRGYNGLKIR